MPAERRSRALLRAAAASLPGPSARLDAELLLAHVLGLERLALVVGDCAVDAAAAARFEALLARRRRFEPVAYILGVREFWSLAVAVSPAVLVPRPDSETLITAAIAALDAPPATILDLGTGSGALLLAALSHWPQAFGVGVDRSAAALAVARANAAALGFGERSAFVQGDWAAAIGGRFDLVLCNPPYVESGAVLPPDVADHEPAAALFAGADGLADYRRILPDIPRLLGCAGIAVIELGAGQCAAVSALAAAAGLAADARPDLAGVARALVLRR